MEKDMSERQPAEVFPPGEFLRDELDARGWTQTEFAEIIGRPPRLINEIIAAKRGITPETARDFAAALGTSAQFWMNLETAYQLSKARPAAEAITRHAKLREKFPVREMIKRGWLEASPNLEVTETRLLAFFNLTSIDEELRMPHAARRNRGTVLSPFQLAWLFRVKQLAEALHVQKYSEKDFRSALDVISALMMDPEEIRHIPKILSECGVRFVIVEPIPGSKIDGVCFWINNSTNPVIGMSLRHDRIDNFWFCIRHESEHVLNKDGQTEWVIDELDDTGIKVDESEAERVANTAAEEFCVPTKALQDFIARHHPMYSETNLIGFAKLMKRHPGVVAGQLRNKTNQYHLFSKYLVKIRQHIVPAALTDGYGRTCPIAV
jgi:HTH-type transcriptional regulator / antitoxin HigA